MRRWKRARALLSLVRIVLLCSEMQTMPHPAMTNAPQWRHDSNQLTPRMRSLTTMTEEAIHLKKGGPMTTNHAHYSMLRTHLTNMSTSRFATFHPLSTSTHCFQAAAARYRGQRTELLDRKHNCTSSRCAAGTARAMSTLQRKVRQRVTIPILFVGTVFLT